MLLPWLMRLIETHADELTEKVIKAVRTNPRMAFLHDVSEPELKRRIFDLYHNLGRWLGEKSEAEIGATYRENGRRRFGEGVPLSELNDLPETATDLYGGEQREMMGGQFFDKALYHAVRGYEEAWLKEFSLPLLAGTAPGPGTTGATMNIARAVVGELMARRGVLDSDTGLRSVTFAVKLEPSRKVSSVTVQQESETQRHQR